MSTIPHTEPVAATRDHIAIAVKASSDAIRFRIVERFLCEVERWLLRPAKPNFNVHLIKEAIRTLRSAQPGSLEESPAAAEQLLDREFQIWEKQIEEKDSGIETYNFRRFCDSSAEPLENEIFIALAAFYRERPYSHATQSKFDLVVTRLYTDVDRWGTRFLKLNQKEVAKHIADKIGDVDELTKSKRFLDTAGAVAAIHSFIAEAQGLEDFESLIQCRLFDRYREFKQELGNQFFDPQVVAAAIQCNTIFSNAFNEMLEAANENLNEILTSDIDLPAALHDAAPNAQEHLSDLLKEFFDFTPDDRFIREGKVSDHLLELLAMARENYALAEEQTDPLTERPDFQFDVTRSARERLLPFLETLTKPEPDAALLLGQLKRSASLKNLSLSDFLYSANHSADTRSRRILGLILWSEEFLQNELGRAKTLTPTAQTEVLSLIQKSEEFAAVLRSDIEASNDLGKGRLLSVLNALLESRLRLEGAIVRFTHRNFAPTPPAKTLEKATETTPVILYPEIEENKSASTNRWLLWLLAVLALAAAAYYFYPRSEVNVPNDSSVTEKIDAARLPGHDHIAAAYGRGNTMFVTARPSWNKLSPDEQKVILKNLLDNGGTVKYDCVLLRDASGHLLGNISAFGAYVTPDVGPAATR